MSTLVNYLWTNTSSKWLVEHAYTSVGMFKNGFAGISQHSVNTAFNLDLHCFGGRGLVIVNLRLMKTPQKNFIGAEITRAIFSNCGKINWVIMLRDHMPLIVYVLLTSFSMKNGSTILPDLYSHQTVTRSILNNRSWIF